MEEYVSVIRGIEMGRSFQFYCMECELNLILYEGIKKNPQINCVNFFCFNCNKITHHNLPSNNYFHQLLYLKDQVRLCSQISLSCQRETYTWNV